MLRCFITPHLLLRTYQVDRSFKHTICIAPWKVFLESGITRLPFGPVLLSQPRSQWRFVSHRLLSPSECLCFCSRALSPQRGSACRSATWRERAPLGAHLLGVPQHR